MKNKNALPIKWMLGILVILMAVTYWAYQTSGNMAVPAASNVSSHNNFFQFLANMIGIRNQKELMPTPGHVEASAPNFVGAPGSKSTKTSVRTAQATGPAVKQGSNTAQETPTAPTAVFRRQNVGASTGPSETASNVETPQATGPAAEQNNPEANAENNPGNLSENNAGINAQNGSESNPGNLPQGGSEGSLGGSSGGINPENLSQGGWGSNPGSNSGSNSGSYSGCVLGCYPGCNPGCDPACKPSVCNFGNTSGNTSGSASGSASGSTSGSTSGSINQYYLPTINPIPTDAQVSLSVAQQNQQNDKIAALVTAHQALVLPVQQQAQASKYQTVNPDNIQAPSTNPAPDDAVQKIKSNQVVYH